MTRQAPSEFNIAAWPALLTTELACAYTSLGEQSFRLLARKSGVEPVDCGGLAVTRWRRGDLDRLIDSLPTKGAPIAPNGPPPANDPASAAAAALERARRRRRG